MLNVFLRPLSVLAWGLCLALGAAAQGSDIVVGQSTDLSGILAEIGTETSWGAKAYFETVNAKGGVNGRKIRSWCWTTPTTPTRRWKTPGN